MKVQSLRRIQFVAMVALFVSIAASSASAAQTKRYIVVFKDTVARPGELAEAQTARPDRKLGFVYRGGLKGYSAALPPVVAKALRSNPRVKAVRRDHIVVPAAQSTPTGVDRVFATANEALGIGDGNAPPVDADVAVIDAGVDHEHLDLDVVARTDCSNGSEEEAECVDGGGSASNHGTHVAGTIAALDNGEGVVGVAPGARIWSAKVLGSGANWESEIVAGVTWVTSHAEQVEVANVSIGCPELPCFLPTMGEAILESAKAGVVYAVAAGNNGGDANLSTFGYNEGMITVSALADFDGEPGGEAGASECREEFEEKWGSHGDDVLAAFSNYGSGIELAAPGVCILSTEAGGGYGYMNGTSMASPHVAGAAAILVAEDNPGDLGDVEAIGEALAAEGNSEWEDTSGDEIQEPLLDLGNEGTFHVDGWRIQSTSSPEGAKEGRLEAVSCSSPAACTAVGYYEDGSGIQRTLAERWNGTEWTIQSTPNPEGGTDNRLRGVSCASATSCTAAGYYKNGSGLWRTLAMSWNGTEWTIQSTPNPEGEGTRSPFLEAVSCAAVTACTATGYYNIQGAGPESRKTLALRWDGSEWTIQSTPNPEETSDTLLKGVSCASATACMATGYFEIAPGTWRTLAMRWEGAEWEILSTLHPEGAKLSYLEGVSCASSGACVATGYQQDGSSTWRTLAEHWNGSKWEIKPTPHPQGASESYLYGVSCVGSAECTAVGKYRDAAGRTRTLAERWDGSNWGFQPTATPEGAKTEYLPLLGVSCSYATACEAVGYYQNSASVFGPLAEQLLVGPPQAITESATELSSAGATLNATVNPLDAETTYQFEYGTTAGYGSSAPASPKGIGSGIDDVQVDEEIEGLEPETTYHFRVVATNADEETTYGEDETFKTTAEPLTYAFPVGEEGAGDGQFDHPSDVAIDSEGHVWVSDNLNHRIQEFDAEGKYLSQFGEYGSGNGQLYYPVGIAFDSAGHIWVSDNLNHRIQEFDAEGKYLSQFGEYGSGNGQLDHPHAVAFDSEGDIWVVDTTNHRIQEFDSEGKYLSQFGEKGSGNGQLEYPEDIVIDPESGTILVADTGNTRVQAFSQAGKYLSQFGEKGSGNGQFSHPARVAVDAGGHIWVTDTGNDRVQEFDAGKNYLSQFGEEGTGSSQMNAPHGLAFGAGSDVWVVDVSNDRVTKWTDGPVAPLATTGAATAVGQTEATLNGTVYPGESETTYQFEYGTTTEYGEKIPASPKSVGAGKGDVVVNETPTGLQAGTTYHYRLVAENSLGTTYGEDRILTTLGAPVATTETATDVQAAKATLNGTVNPEGFETTYQFEYGPTTEYGTKVPTSPESIGAGTNDVEVEEPIEGLEPETEYHFRVVASNSKGTTYGKDLTFETAVAAPTFDYSFGEYGASEGQFIEPRGLSAGSEGIIWVADTSNHRIVKLDSEGEVLLQQGSLGSGEGQFALPLRIDVGAEGDVWVADFFNIRMQWLDAEAEYLSHFSTGEGVPRDLAIDSEGNLVVAIATHHIEKFNPQGESLSEFGEAGSGNGQFQGPWGIALDGKGNILVADAENHRIQIFNSSGAYLSQFGEEGSGSGQFNYPSGIALDGEGNILVADSGNDRIQIFNSAGEYLTEFGEPGSGEGQFDQPYDVDVDSAGNIWVADAGNDRIQRWSY